MTRLLFLISTLCLFSSIAIAGVGQPVINIFMADSGPDPICLMVIPDGSGSAMTDAKTDFGGSADATITVEILDQTELPVADFPAEDIWLESDDGGLAPCRGGTIADNPTNAIGRTTISGALRAGGWSLSMTKVFVNGDSNTNPQNLSLVFNSPDINGDLLVNLSDVQLFAGDFYGSYHFRSDLAFDNVINLSDIVPLSRSLGATCP